MIIDWKDFVPPTLHIAHLPLNRLSPPPVATSTPHLPPSLATSPPHSTRLPPLPPFPFVGEAYEDYFQLIVINQSLTSILKNISQKLELNYRK